MVIKQENLLGEKDGCTGRLEAANMSDNHKYFSGLKEILFFIRENQQSLKSDV